MAKKFDFGGYATKVNLRCSDGRVIMPDAFKDNDGQTVPLVWEHLHDSPDNVLGHARLENRKDGVYAYCSFNDTDAGKNAALLVKHGDITSLSIYANKLVEKSKAVIHGMIREVSLVFTGANPGARIDNLEFEHSDGSKVYDKEEAIIHSGIDFSVDDPEEREEEETEEEETEEEETEEVLEHADEETVGDVFDTLSEKQKNLVYAMIGEILEEQSTATHSNDEGEDDMKHNVFSDRSDTKEKATLTHTQFETILDTAKRAGSFKEAFFAHAGDYGIDNIEILFPDARNVTPTPDFIKREMDWVQGVLSGTKHSPFARIKSVAADITADEARAKGYVKGEFKKEEVISVLKRVTTPTTIYKKQKLDRDDIVDITDMDVVAWLKAEMKMMLNEEIARAVLVSDGRDAEDGDKINEVNIRPIYTDDDLYAHHVDIAAAADTSKIIETIIRSRVNYKGSGNPTFYTTSSVLADMLLLTDSLGRRLYNTEAELASVLRVKNIVEVPVMEGLTRTRKTGFNQWALIGIIVNLADYTIGADKGGEISMFDDFDIDYNQQKYLIETRISGALIHPKSALVIEQIVE